MLLQEQTSGYGTVRRLDRHLAHASRPMLLLSHSAGGVRMLLRRKASDTDLLRLAVRVLDRLRLLQVQLLQRGTHVQRGIVCRLGLCSVRSFW